MYDGWVDIRDGGKDCDSEVRSCERNSGTGERSGRRTPYLGGVNTRYEDVVNQARTRTSGGGCREGL